MAMVLAVGGVVFGPLRSLLIVGVPSTFAMPILGAVGDWGAGVRPSKRGAWLMNSILVVVAAAALTLLGQLVVGHIDPAGAVRGVPVSHQHELSTFPYLIPLGALAFVTFLQLSIVSEARIVFPARFGPAAGRIAVVLCGAVALVAYLLLANWNAVPSQMRHQIGLINPGGPLPGLDIATWLIVTSVWQAAYLLLDGWPYSLIARRPLRIAVANIAVIALGSATYWLGLDVVGLNGPQLAAVGAMCIGGELLVGPLLGAWSKQQITPGRLRAALAASAIAAAAALYVGLHTLGLGLSHGWTINAPVELWMVICGLNLIGGGVLWYTRIISIGRTGTEP